MTTITISRQFGSGGDEIANRVCDILGYRRFDKRVLVQAAVQSGLSEQEVIDYSEEDYKVRSFLERLLGRSATIATVRVWEENVSGIRMPDEIKLSEASVLSLVQNAIRSAHKLGNIVIVGRGGQVLLKDEKDVLHVRIIAPMEDRIQFLKEQIKPTRQSFGADLTLRREAQDKIVARDEASAEYLKTIYGVDWNDPAFYHMLLNTSKLTLDQASQVIAAAAQEMASQATGLAAVVT